MSKEFNQLQQVYMIFLDEEVLLSKKEYSNWRDIQDEYYMHFKTSFPAMRKEDIIQYYVSDYGADDAKWPFSRKKIQDFFNSEDTILRSSASDT